MKNISIILLIAFIYSGCSSKYRVTFDSNPRGASLVCGGENLGYTPITKEFNEKVKEHTSLNLKSCSANWISGATEQYGVIDLTQFPNEVTQTLQRPYGKGYEKDAQFGLQVETMYAQRRQATYQRLQLEDMERQGIQRNLQLQQINNNLNGIRYGY